MEKFIDGKIREVFRDFQQEAASVGELCECKGLTYEGGNSPDYGNPLVRENYMLRFFSGIFSGIPAHVSENATAEVPTGTTEGSLDRLRLRYRSMGTVLRRGREGR